MPPFFLFFFFFFSFNIIFPLCFYLIQQWSSWERERNEKEEVEKASPISSIINDDNFLILDSRRLGRLKNNVMEYYTSCVKSENSEKQISFMFAKFYFFFWNLTIDKNILEFLVWFVTFLINTTTVEKNVEFDRSTWEPFFIS